MSHTLELDTRLTVPDLACHSYPSSDMFPTYTIAKTGLDVWSLLN